MVYAVDPRKLKSLHSAHLASGGFGGVLFGVDLDLGFGKGAMATSPRYPELPLALAGRAAASARSSLTGRMGPALALALALLWDAYAIMATCASGCSAPKFTASPSESDESEWMAIMADLMFGLPWLGWLACLLPGNLQEGSPAQ